MYSGYLTSNGFVIKDAILRLKLGAAYDEFMAALTIRTPQKIGPELVGRAYKYAQIAGKNCVYLPRTLIPALLRAGVINEFTNMITSPAAVEYNFICELFQNQRVIVNWFMENIFCKSRADVGTAVGTLNLRAGMGKTFVAAGVIAALKARTLYIVPKKPLLVQAIRELKLCFEGANIGKYTGTEYKKDKHKNVASQQITVIIINSALSRPPEFFAGYDLIIMDEIHSFASSERQEIFWKAQSRYIFGMSATTSDRLDNFDFIYHKHYGAVIMAENIPGFTYDAVHFDCNLRAVKYSGPAEYTRVLHGPTGMMAPYLMARQSLRDPYRNKLIVDTIREFYNWRDGDKKHHIYVFAEELGPLNILYDMLKDEFPSDELGNFVGGIEADAIEEIRVNSRIILTTYRYGGTGVSFEQMTVSIFLTSRKANMLQILARILRRNGDQTIPRWFIDIIDTKTPIRKQYEKRRLAYDFYGAKINEVSVSYTELTADFNKAVTPGDPIPGAEAKKIEIAKPTYNDYLDALNESCNN